MKISSTSNKLSSSIDTHVVENLKNTPNKIKFFDLKT